MNNKILSVVLVAGIATTGFAGISAASENASGEKGIQIMEKHELKNHSEQKKDEKGFKGHGKRKGFKHLSDEEKIDLESMSDDERKTFFEEKKSQMETKKNSHKKLVDTLISGNTLSPEQEILRSEMLEKMSQHEGKKGKKEGVQIIAKLLAGEELTAEDETILTGMQTKHAEHGEKGKHKGNR